MGRESGRGKERPAQKWNIRVTATPGDPNMLPDLPGLLTTKPGILLRTPQHEAGICTSL